MKTWTKQQALTYSILLIMLVADFAQPLLILVYDDLLSPTVKANYVDQFKFWIIGLLWLLILGGFPLIALVIRLNQERLQKLNIDRFFIIILIISGLIGLYTLPYNFFVVIALCYLIYCLFSKKPRFAVFDRNTLRTILLIVGVSVGIMFCIASLVNSVRIDPHAEQSLQHFVLNIIPLSIYEEAIYRGMLYMFLIDLGLSESKVLYTQAFLFWITHISHLFRSPLFFWVILPILSVILGYIVFRSKSLTPSTFAHILYNAFVEFIVF